MTVRKVSLILVAAALVFALTGCGLAPTIREKIRYDNGTLGGGATLLDGTENMEAAVCFPSLFLSTYDYVGRQIMGVEFYNNAFGDRGVTVRLYSAGTASGDIVRQKTDMVRRGWRVIYFDTPYTITGSDLWVSWETMTDTSIHPFGFDNDISASPDARFWRLAGDLNWQTATSGNFMIRAILY